MSLVEPLAGTRDLDHREILELSPKVYELVAKYKGSITGEHGVGREKREFMPVMYAEPDLETMQRVLPKVGGKVFLDKNAQGIMPLLPLNALAGAIATEPAAARTGGSK